MRYIKSVFFLFFIMLFVMACTPSGIMVDVIGEMPDEEPGYALGVSACYVATSDSVMLLAGGCNFPETPAADGGAKRYYKGVYSASYGETVLRWRKIGELPEASAYGASLQYGCKLIIAGGMNENGASDKVYMLDACDDACRVEQLPSLPCKMDNAAGAVSGNFIYVAGGNADGSPSNRVFMLDMNNVVCGWSEIVPFPGLGRVQPVCAATFRALYLWGGFTPKGQGSDAVVHCNGVKFDFLTGAWSILPEFMDETNRLFTLSGGTAVAFGDENIVATGGVNREIFEDAISGTYNCVPQEEYMLRSPGWYKFNDRLLLFDVATESWDIVTRNNYFARAGAVLTTDGESLFYVGGELKPGIRTPEIIQISFQSND